MNYEWWRNVEKNQHMLAYRDNNGCNNGQQSWSVNVVIQLGAGHYLAVAGCWTRANMLTATTSQKATQDLTKLAIIGGSKWLRGSSALSNTFPRGNRNNRSASARQMSTIILRKSSAELLQCTFKTPSTYLPSQSYSRIHYRKTRNHVEKCPMAKEFPISLEQCDESTAAT